MYRHSDAQELQYSTGYRDFCPSIALRSSSLTSAGGTVLIQVISNSFIWKVINPHHDGSDQGDFDENIAL
jgi:hypothetical protein